MTDTELARLVLQGGSFGILVLLAIWWARVGHPRLMKTFDDNREDNKGQRQEFLAALKCQRDEFAGALKSQWEGLTQALRTQREEYTAALARIEAQIKEESEDCRRDRREQQRAMIAERDADREARHAAASQFQSIITELFDRVAPKPNDERGAE